jgi:hypothetical protein
VKEITNLKKKRPGPLKGCRTTVERMNETHLYNLPNIHLKEEKYIYTLIRIF